MHEAPLGRRKLRICQFTPCLWSGGTEERIARVLGAMDRREFEVSWMGFGPVREALIERAGPGVRVVPIARNPLGGIESQVVGRVAMALSQIRPHVIHIHNWSTSLYGIAGSRLVGVPRLIFGMGGRETPDRPPPRRQLVMRALTPHVDRFTSVCEFLGSELAEDFSIPPERVTVLRTGVDVDRIDAAPAKEIARERFGIPNDAIVIGAISVFRPVKRIPDLIEAVGRLAAERPNVHLLLVGNPVRMTVEELREQADRAGLAGRIHMPGRIEDPPSILKAFDIFVNCSIFEGSSNAIIEAMAASIPVVGTAVGGTPELIVDGINGSLVPPRDVDSLTAALGALVDDPELRATMGTNGRKRITRKHSYDKMVAAYVDLYREMAQEAVERGGTMRQTFRTLRGLSRTVQTVLDAKTAA